VDPDDLPDGLVVADETGQVVEVNAVAAALLRTPADELLRKDIAAVLPLADQEGRSWWAATDPYGGLPTRTGQPERSLYLPDGRELLVTARYVRRRRAGPVRRLVVALRSAHVRERQQRGQAELVATVAHELRSPLTSVKGFTATLLRKWERFTDDQKRLMLETVDADADRLTRLITELLDIARIDSGRLELRRRPVDLAAVVRRHVDGLVAGGQPADRFVVRAPQPLPELWLDPDKIDQVFANLLENAMRHGRGSVTVVLEPREGGAVATISDEGPGIPEELVGRIFTRFWRDPRRGGTGLGLYIVKGLIEAHGGTIEVARSAGGGAAFRFFLPPGTPEFALDEA
jgi:signal transduction histidine kinase